MRYDSPTTQPSPDPEDRLDFAQRIQTLPPYLFAEISKKMAEKRAQGVDVISFGIGDPDLPTPDRLLDALAEPAKPQGKAASAA